MVLYYEFDIIVDNGFIIIKSNGMFVSKFVLTWGN